MEKRKQPALMEITPIRANCFFVKLNHFIIFKQHISRIFCLVPNESESYIKRIFS